MKLYKEKKMSSQGFGKHKMRAAEGYMSLDFHGKSSSVSPGGLSLPLSAAAWVGRRETQTIIQKRTPGKVKRRSKF